MGAMRQKMAIFKDKHSVCRGPFFSGALILYNGGDVDENRHFIEGKLVAHGQFEGGDVDENRHYIEGKLVAHGQIFNIFQNCPRCEQLGGDASGNGDFQRRKQRLLFPSLTRLFA